MKKILYWSVITFLLSCANDDEVFMENDFQSGWHTDSLATFIFHPTDTVSLFSTQINLRHTEKYPYQNLIVFVHFSTPMGETTTDTINCMLADNFGKWIGKNTGDVLDFSVLYKDSVQFNTSGDYKISVEQAMRYGNLPNIELLEEVLSVGISIKKR